MRVATTALPHAEPGLKSAKKSANTDGTVDSGAFLRAIVAARLGDDPEAAQAFRDALRTDPGNDNLLKQAFVRSVMAGDPQAVQLARKSGDAAGRESVIAALVLGNDALSRGAWADAVRYYRQAEIDPLAHLIMPLLMAWCEQAQGHADKAIARLVSIQGSVLVPFYTTHAGLIAHAGGLQPQAGILFEQAHKMMPAGDLLLARSYAAWLWSQGKHSQARDLLRAQIGSDAVLALAGPGLQAAIARFPVSTARAGIARAYVLTAFLLREQAHDQIRRDGTDPMKGAANRYQIDEATRLMLGFALGMDPAQADARLMLAEIQDEEGYTAAARRTLQHIAPDDPLAPVANLRLAVMDTSSDQVDEAVTLLSALARQAQGQVVVQRALGNALAQKKDWKGAIAAYTRALDIGTAQKNTDWTLLFLRASAYYEAGDWPHARDDGRAALAYAPDEPMLLNFLGYSMAERRENLPEASRLLSKAHQLAPQDAAITDSLGWALLEQGDLAGGMPLLEKAAELTPEDAEINYHLGEAYWRVGRRTEAVDQWNMALGLHPNAADEERIRAALRRAGVAQNDDKTQPESEKGNHTL
ncbi:tetratricopeptide repeat protein [Acetobacter garciniae]|uniref:tetratricopeptide repeat protein n=1 Tax=Acetobacter garciniae TaxID=2817435 RepID=UPI001E32107A|nr:tetratricopeptide repeat protein [Acetobacter garciniae]